eukprot:185565_1
MYTRGNVVLKSLALVTQSRPYLPHCFCMLQIFGLLTAVSFTIRGVVTSNDVYGEDGQNTESMLVRGFTHEFEEYDNLPRVVPETTLDIISSYLKLPPEVFKLDLKIPKTAQIDMDSVHYAFSTIKEICLLFACNSYYPHHFSFYDDRIDIPNPDIVLTSNEMKKHNEMTLTIRSNQTIPKVAQCADRLWVTVKIITHAQSHPRTDLYSVQAFLQSSTNSIQLTVVGNTRRTVCSHTLRPGPSRLVVHFAETMSCWECVFSCGFCCCI